MTSLKSMRNNPLHTSSLILHGNGKLTDYDNPETGEHIRYAQYNTRALKDCPFRSVGCTAICYATKGNHVFPSVIESRERSYEVTKRDDFTEVIVYTIRTEKQSKRYKDAVMQIRIHESGDFYSVQYLRKWVRAWDHFTTKDGVRFVLYTKSFRFFLMLNDEEKAIINRLLTSGVLAISWSMDDTTTTEQRIACLECVKTFPKANIYICTEHVDAVQHDNVCDCADCAKCGICNNTNGTVTVVRIHSATTSDMEVYRANIK